MQAPVYRRRDPQNSPYYQCVEDHFETFEMIYDDRFGRQYGFFRPYVKQVIYRYLDCGVLKNGFARIRCESCGHGVFNWVGGAGRRTQIYPVESLQGIAKRNSTGQTQTPFK